MATARAFDGQTLARIHRPLAVEWPAQRIDDAPEQGVAYGHIHDPARALDFIAGVQIRVIAEQHDADLVLVHVEGDAVPAARKLHQLLGTDARETGDFGNARGDRRDHADFTRDAFGHEAFARLAQARECPIENTLQGVGRCAHEGSGSGFPGDRVSSPIPRCMDAR